MGDKVAVQFRLSPALVKRLRHHCIDVGWSRSAVVEAWLTWHLDNLDAEREWEAAKQRRRAGEAG